LITLIVFSVNYFLQKKIKIEVAKNLAQAELLMQQNRKAELGGLIANISHQWKNGLAKIGSTNLQMLFLSDMGSVPSSKEIKTYAMDIENSILFMSQTMDIFLNFYKDNQKKEVFVVSETLREALTIVDAKIKADHADICINIINDIEIVGIKNEWIHIWLNLVNNSIKAAKEMKNPTVKITINSSQIVYRDNCGGFDKETLMAVNKGMHSGLGVKMSRDILKKYSYAISISNQDNGAEIVIFNNEI
jgi:signal transduction histidine kinase